MSKTPATYNEPNSRFCGTVKDANGNAKPAEPQPVEIKFIPDSGTTIDFPQDSSFLFFSLRQGQHRPSGYWY